MQLECKVRVVKRNPGTKSCGYYLKSTLVLGKETHTDNDYFLLHFWNVLRRGSLEGSHFTKYRLKFNPTKIFTKCLSEGKATVCFEDPQHDLFIQGNVMQLSIFVETLNICLAGVVGALPSTSTIAEARNRFDDKVDEQKTLLDAKEATASCSKEVKK